MKSQKGVTVFSENAEAIKLRLSVISMCIDIDPRFRKASKDLSYPLQYCLMVHMMQENSLATIFLEESVLLLSGHCVEENTVYDSTIQPCTKQ